VNEKLLILLAVVGVTLISIIFTNPNLFPSDNPNVVLTGTPADYFPEEQRSKFCGTGNATSNNYVKEYKIPTDCTLPQAIIADEFGNIWFVESTLGRLAKFDPVSESFFEYHNPFWPSRGHSMIWGIDYSPDGIIWFTDEKHRSVWSFLIPFNKISREESFACTSKKSEESDRIRDTGSNVFSEVKEIVKFRLYDSPG